MRKGLIGFKQSSTVLGRTIQAAQIIEHGKNNDITPNHVFIVIEKNGVLGVIEALENGVIFTEWNKCEYKDAKNVALFEFCYIEERIDVATKWVLKQEGKPYDFLGTGFFMPIHIYLRKKLSWLIPEKRAWLGKYGKDERRWFCSRLGAYFINKATPGYLYNHDAISPDELFDMMIFSATRIK